MNSISGTRLVFRLFLFAPPIDNSQTCSYTENSAFVQGAPAARSGGPDKSSHLAASAARRKSRKTAMAERFKIRISSNTLLRTSSGIRDDVKTDRTIDERGVLITLHVNPEDMGYVIGRQGQTARSIRTLLKIVGPRTTPASISGVRTGRQPPPAAPR